MFAWHRATVAALLITIGVAGTARAQSPQKHADQLSKEGSALLKADFPDPTTPEHAKAAADKFRQAAVLSPEARFYYNLCIALSVAGDNGNALMACQAVSSNSPTPELQDKTNKLAEQIKDQLRKQGVSADEVTNAAKNPTNGTNPNGTNPDGTNPNGTNPNGTNPNGTNPNGTNPNGTNPNGFQNPPIGANPNLDRFRGAPPPALLQVAQPTHDYTYTFGAMLEGAGSSIGSGGYYAKGAGGFRLIGDLMLSQASKVGGEGYIDYMNIASADTASHGGMSLVDVGVAGYKHICKNRMCITPLVGAHVVVYEPSDSSQSNAYVSLGLRAQGQLGYAFGSRYEHFLSVSLGIDVDFKPLGTYDFAPSTYGLDSGGTLVLIALGYTYRFNTPFGQQPFFQLE